MKKRTTTKTSAAKRKKRPVRKKTGKKKQLRISLWAITVILALALICVFLPYIRNRSEIQTGAKIPYGTYSYGIDISHYQNKIIWDSLRVMTDSRRNTTSSKIHARDIKPVSFVFIKATEGASLKDKRFNRHWKDAGNHEIRRGAYHFFRSSKDPLQQARLFVRTVGEIRPTDLPPVLDIETIHKGCSKAVLNDKALIWLEAVEKHYGRKPLVYSSSSFIIDLLDDQIRKNYPIWVAHYETESPGYKNWDIWQFTDKGVVYGIDGYVDLNVCSIQRMNTL